MTLTDSRNLSVTWFFQPLQRKCLFKAAFDGTYKSQTHSKFDIVCKCLNSLSYAPCRRCSNCLSNSFSWPETHPLHLSCVENASIHLTQTYFSLVLLMSVYLHLYLLSLLVLDFESFDTSCKFSLLRCILLMFIWACFKLVSFPNPIALGSGLVLRNPWERPVRRSSRFSCRKCIVTTKLGTSLIGIWHT